MKANPIWVLTLSSLKMWIRDRQAIFWSLFLPLLIMVILGLMNFGAFGNVNLGIVDLADNEASHSFAESMKSIEALDISLGASLADERQALIEGDRHLVLVLPPTFGVSREATELQVLYNEGSSQEVQVGQACRSSARDAPRELLDKGFRKDHVEKQASLEDVFLDMTGHALREE